MAQAEAGDAAAPEAGARDEAAGDEAEAGEEGAAGEEEESEGEGEGEGAGEGEGDVYEVESIRKKRMGPGEIEGGASGPGAEYLVRWKGYSSDDDTWEPVEHILDAALLAEFEERRARIEEDKEQRKPQAAGKAGKPAAARKVKGAAFLRV